MSKKNHSNKIEIKKGESVKVVVDNGFMFEYDGKDTVRIIKPDGEVVFEQKNEPLDKKPRTNRRRGPK